MPYESTITFTLDTICPWTHLSLLRLQRALSTAPTPNVSFTLRFAPYQLHPDMSRTGVDKYAWYLAEKYNGETSTMEKYVGYMRGLFEGEGEVWTPEGEMANTLHAHRVVWWVQERRGAGAALGVVRSLYEQYFSEGLHPSAEETLVRACVAGGLSGEEAERLVGDESEGLSGVKSAIREQVGNGVDSVPYVVFEGRRRDFTLVGAKEVGEYVKTLEQVAKEA